VDKAASGQSAKGEAMKLVQTVRYGMVVFAVAAAVVWVSGRVLGIGFILSETKEELKLKYDVLVEDHGTGRVTAVLTLADEGRLKPLDEVELAIPAQEKNADGSYGMDLVVSIGMTEIDGGKRVGRVHIRKDLAERAEIRLNTHTLDGKLDPRTRLHYIIRLAKYMPPAGP
jgi:acylphosphatase